MSTHGDIAIVGMAGVYPKAPDVAAFWENILAKVDAVTDAPPLWGADLVYDPESSAVNRIYTKRGGFISDLSHFNPLAYGIPPRSVEGSDPEHFIALRVAHEALTDSGYLERPFDRERTGVILGRSTVGNRSTAAVFQHGLVIDQTIRLLATLHPEYSTGELELIEQELRADLPPFNAETAPGLVPSVMCGRIANRLDLMGPAYTVDAACASSLLAVELAMADLRSGKMDMALAGGVQTSTTFMIGMIFCQLGALSRQGKVGSFSPDADGTLLGEGAGILVLKRREDAERDNDRIYALLKAVGMLAPRLEGEELAMRRAYELAEVAPHTVSLVEGHGTGTLVGDAIELQGLSRIFGAKDPDGTGDPDPNGPDPDGHGQPWCALGSVKSMIGHPIPAAGSAGLIKIALALYHKVLPPTLHADAGNPKLKSTPFYLNSETRPWIHGGPEPRRGAVSAFGFGGINAHAILEEHTDNGHIGEAPQPHLHRGFDAEVVVLPAQGRAELLARSDELSRLLVDNPELALVDLAYTLNCPVPAPAAPTPTARLAIVATSIADLQAKLGHAADRLADPGCHRIDEPSGIYYTDAPLQARGALAFLFPGMGSQYVNMLADLCIHFPAVRACFDQMDRVFAQQRRGYLPSQAIFPPPTGQTVDPALLWSTSCGFAAVIAANHALRGLIGALGIRPDAVLGHSMGAHSALGEARMSSVDEAEVVDHFLAMNECYEQLRAEDLVPTGALLAIITSEREQVLAVVERGAGALTLAMDNCPHQMVLGGATGAVAAAADELRQAGISCTELPFGHPYHTAAFATFADRLREMYETQAQLELTPSPIALYSCITTELCPDEPEAVARLVTDILSHPVRFRESIEAMYRDGVRIFVEVGPRGSLSTFVDDTLHGMPHLAVPADVLDQSGLTQLAHLVGQLAAHHVPMDLQALYAHRSPQRLPITDGRLPAQPTTDHRGPLLAVHLPLLELATPLQSGTSPSSNGVAGPVKPAVPTQAVPVQPAVPTVPVQPAVPVPPAAAGREQVIQAYLATMDRFLDIQRSIMDTPQPAHTRLPAPTAASRFPLLGAVVSRLDGEELVAIRRLDLDEDLYLHDHTFGRQISVTDPSLLTLAVVPFTVSMEMLAQAAAALCPGQLVVGMRDVRGHQWIGLDDGHATIRLVARRDPTGTGREVKVELQRLDDAAASSQAGTLVFEGVVCFADSYPIPPAPSSLTLTAEQPYAQSAAALYASGRMFHGPRFQGVVSLARWGEDGTEATLETLPTNELFASTPSPALVTDPVLLDAAGQLVGFWAIERLRYGVGTFPFGLKELRLFGPTPVPGTPVRVPARIDFVNEQQVRAEIDLIGPDGRLLAQLVGWSDHCLNLTKSLSEAMKSSPHEAALGAAWKTMIDGLPAPETFVCWRIDELPPDALAAYGRIPQRILAMCILSRAERTTWAGLTGSEHHRSEWLLGQAAAKEAVRVVLRDSFGLDLYPADIAVIADEHDNLVATGSWATGVPRAPLVSLAHCDGVAVALAGADPRCQGVGVHLERLGCTGPTDGARPGQQEWALRLQCAKEAAGKALECGPEGLAAADLDLNSGVVRISAGPTALVPATPAVGLGPEPLIVRTVRDGDWIAAVAIRWEEPTNV